MVKNLPPNPGDVSDAGSIPGEGRGNPLQYSCIILFMIFFTLSPYKIVNAVTVGTTPSCSLLIFLFTDYYYPLTVPDTWLSFNEQCEWMNKDMAEGRGQEKWQG